MISVDLVGGLGNQIFQIYTVIAYSLKYNYIFMFLNQYELNYGITMRYTYWNTFFLKLKSNVVDSLPEYTNISEGGFKYNDLIVNDNTRLNGYFQSYKYFENYKHKIYDIVGIDNLKHNLLNKLNKTSDDFKNVISMHFRLGDYKYLSEFHGILDLKYYIDSLNYFNSFNQPFVIYYLCEEEDIDIVNKKISVLKQMFTFTFIRLTNLADWEQLIFMSLCNHNIIANSSFSWWGAYLNSWNDKKICRPSKWFNEPSIDTSDLCPPSWNVIQNT